MRALSSWSQLRLIRTGESRTTSSTSTGLKVAVAAVTLAVLGGAVLGVAVELVLGRRLRALLAEPVTAEAAPAAGPATRPPGSPAARTAGDVLRARAQGAPPEQLALAWRLSGLGRTLPFVRGVALPVAALDEEQRDRLRRACALLEDGVPGPAAGDRSRVG